MFWQLFLLVVCIWSARYWWQRRRLYDLSKQLPLLQDKWYPIIGQALAFFGSNEDLMTGLRKTAKSAIEQGGIVGGWMANKYYICVADAEVAEFILKNCLDKGTVLMNILRTVSGNGSLFAPLHLWRPRRKILAPVFNIRNLNSFVPEFTRQSLILTKLLEQHVGKEDFSLWKYINAYTFDTIGKTSLGVDFNAQKNGTHFYLDIFEKGAQMISRRLVTPWLYFDLFYKLLPEYKEYTQMRKLGYDFIDDLIKRKKEEVSNRKEQDVNVESKPFLELLVEFSLKDEGYTDLELREEAVVIISAGSDSTAVGVSFAATMLSRYPEVQDKVYKELQAIFGHSNRPMTPADFPKLVYLEAVIKETLRLYPTVPAYIREVTSDITLPSGVTLVNGVGVAFLIDAIHRNPKYWGQDAELFRPERWLEGPLQLPAQFVPFSYGMRNCIGATYAMMSMKSALSSILRQYRLLPPSDLEPAQWTAPLKVEYSITLRHIDKYVVRLEYRNKL